MNDQTPLVSVLMTSYNRENYIAEAIESVLASTYPNFELIIVDDCSTDRTVEIARQYERADERVRIFINEENLGDYVNRNRAASYANGKYLKYVDSDDLIYPHGLEVIVESMERFPDVGMGFISNFNQEEMPYPFRLSPQEAYNRHFYIRGFLDTGPTGLVFNTDKFREIDGFSGKRYIGDLEINMKMAARWPVVKIASALAYWRIHDGQEIKLGLSNSGYLRSELPLLRASLQSDHCPLSAEQKKKITDYHCKMAARHIINMAVKGRKFSEAISLYKELSLTRKDLFAAVFRINQHYK